MIFDEKHEGKDIRKKYKEATVKFHLNGVELEPDEDFFDDDGQEVKD
jgi:hypothetical protein